MNDIVKLNRQYEELYSEVKTSLRAYNEAVQRAEGLALKIRDKELELRQKIMENQYDSW